MNEILSMTGAENINFVLTISKERVFLFKGGCVDISHFNGITNGKERQTCLDMTG